MSGACDNFILEDQSCEWFDLVQYVESFDMGISFLQGPPGPPGPAGEAIFIPFVSQDGWISWTNTAGLPNPDPVYIKGPPGGGGSGDYDDLTDKPSINGVTLSGNKTTAELLIRFSAADVGLGNVANERQYSAQNPPPYPVTSVDGKVGAVSVLPVGGTFGQVLKKASATDYDAVWADESGGGGSGDYADLTNKPSINGVTLSGNKTTADLLISFSAADVGLGNVANERQYSAQNPPPYPVTSVNGQTGAVTIPVPSLPLSVSDGGTGSTTAGGARENLFPFEQLSTEYTSQSYVTEQAWNRCFFGVYGDLLWAYFNLQVSTSPGGTARTIGKIDLPAGKEIFNGGYFCCPAQNANTANLLVGLGADGTITIQTSGTSTGFFRTYFTCILIDAP